MSELKTLKDIKIEGSNGRLRLKAEAVKWVKDRQARKENKQYLDVQLAIFDEQIGWIKHFFNLTEEDLK